MPNLSRLVLLRATDDHFAFLLGEQSSPENLLQPPGGVDTPGMLRMLRRMVARLHQAGCDGHWLILHENEVVGLCGYKRPPDAAKTVEIGYGIAAERRGTGYATRAIGLLLEQARASQAVDKIIAETVPDNLASRRVLQRNGFTRIGAREDAEDGPLELWDFDF